MCGPSNSCYIININKSLDVRIYGDKYNFLMQFTTLHNTLWFGGKKTNQTTKRQHLIIEYVAEAALVMTAQRDFLVSFCIAWLFSCLNGNFSQQTESCSMTQIWSGAQLTGFIFKELRKGPRSHLQHYFQSLEV